MLRGVAVSAIRNPTQGTGTYIVRNAGDLVRPDFLLPQWVIRVTLGKEMLEEAHVLQAEEGNLVVWLLRLSASEPAVHLPDRAANEPGGRSGA